MSNQAHILMNAMSCLRNDISFEEYASNKTNIDLANKIFPEYNVLITLNNIWNIAIQVYYSWLYNNKFFTEDYMEVENGEDNISEAE